MTTRAADPVTTPPDHRLTPIQGFSLAVSSTAPWYSLMATAPLISQLVGAGAAVAYLLAAVPAMLVALGMNANDRRDPDKGTVYTWVRRRFARLGWFAGFCLAVTGVVATSGMAYVAADLILPGQGLAAKLALGLGLMVVAAWIDYAALRAMALLQALSIVLGLIALGWAAYLLATGRLQLAPVTGGPWDWVHAVLLAVFAYWGFDAIFALSEQTATGTPQRVANLSMAALAVMFALGAVAMSAANREVLTDALLVKAAIVVSATMSLGSTLIPTARGMESMAEADELPAARWLSGRLAATATTTALAVVWLGWLLVSTGLFEDTIEALSIFVGLYFTASSAIAALHAERGRGRTLHSVSAVLMAVVTVLVLVQVFDAGYGETSVAGVGGVGLIVVGFLVLGAIGVLTCVRRVRPDATKPRGESHGAS